MLKPAADGRDGPSFGELATRLVEDGKAYARAEIDLAKAIAADKTRTVRLAAILFGVAVLFAIGAMTAVAIALFVTLAAAIGPVLAGLVTFLVLGGIAGGLAWLGVNKLNEAL